jgi:hypothetical protein
MLTSDTGIMTIDLPSDPEDGDIYTPPNPDLSLGATLIITLIQCDKVIGSASTLAPVMNASKKYTLTRISVIKPLVKYDIVRVIATQYYFKQMKYVDVWGWYGICDESSKQIIRDNTFKIVRAVPLGINQPNYNIYESLHLELIKGV